jgi:subfamily B ATP-binding cassette protein MsbA
MSPLKRILRIAKPHRKYLFSSIFFNLLYSFFQIFSIIVMLPVLQMIFNVKTEKIEKPQFSGSFIKYFDYLKDLALYNIQEKFKKMGQ